MSLEPLLRGLFDYAGMFPPAALPFDETLAKSARFPTSLRRPLMLGNDIVLTPENLAKLDRASLGVAQFADRPCNVCLVGVALEDAPAHAEAIVAFNEARRDDLVPQRITALEVHGGELDDAAEHLRQARRVIGNVDLYFEPKWEDARMSQEFGDATSLLHGLRSDGRAIGFKVRCAGPTAVSHETLAAIFVDVNRRRLPLKLTQGLHHPFVGDSVHKNEHGFLNAAFALRLQHALGMAPDQVVACLKDDEPANFSWDAGLAWDGHIAMMQRIEEAMQAVPFAIGSCSLDEPDQELSSLLD